MVERARADMVALPCRYIIVDCSMYHTCSLLDGCVCQVINPYLTDTTAKMVMTPSERTYIGNPDEGNFKVLNTDFKVEILSVERPPELPVLDTECPAGYTWQKACAKFEAAHKLFEEHGAENAQRTNTMIRNIHKTNIMEAENL